MDNMEMNAYALRNENFIDTIDVSCPKCEARALVMGGQPFGIIKEYEDKVRFSCVSCGYAVKYINTPESTFYTNSRGLKKTGRVLIMNAPCDPFFGFGVWYFIETKYGLLWAYNELHLSVIENYIANPLRGRNGLPNKNNSIASRLPQWAKDAKNRDYLVKMINRYK